MTEDSLTISERNRVSADPWDVVETKPNVETLERGLYLSCFDMLLTEDTAWLVKVSEASPTLAVPMTRMEPREEPEQCPVIDSQEQGLSPGLEGQEEERSLEQMQSMVVGEVLKDIETACKLLNITPGRLFSTTPAPVHMGVTVLRNTTDKEAKLKSQQKNFHDKKISQSVARYLQVKGYLFWILFRKINTYFCGWLKLDDRSPKSYPY